jgi:hypothetical protein
MYSAKWIIGMVSVAGMLAAEGQVLKEWRFDQGGPQGWDARINHVAEVRVADGALQARILDWDPWITSPQFEVPASPYQVVELRLKTDCGGQGQLYYSNTTDTPYGGFMPEKLISFDLRGDGQWHTYRIFPFWQAEKKIILLRLDVARPAAADNGKKSFAMEWLRIVELAKAAPATAGAAWDFAQNAAGWEAQGATSASATAGAWALQGGADEALLLRSPPAPFSADSAGDWVVIEMAVDRGRTAVLGWASASAKGRSREAFAVKPDGLFHVYNLLLGGATGWSGDILALELEPSEVPGAAVQVRRIQVSPDPIGPPAIEVRTAGAENAITRCGQPLPFSVSVRNLGGEVCRGLRVESMGLPEGVRVASAAGWERFPDIDVLDVVTLRFTLAAERAVDGEFELRLSGPGAPEESRKGRLQVSPALALPKASYVPEPQPVASDYEVGALYFPGWPTIGNWARIWPEAPERKPVLGWYDEANPECVDWQIKWAVENGLSYFLVDWYWDRGGIHLDHWVKAFQKARYKSYLKWAMMWANHNGAGSHSEEDQRQVTKFWIDNYFGTPEYYRINDMPVVMIWSPTGMNSDLEGKGGVKRLLEISREMARAAGYKGIWFMTMKWPEASTEAKDIQWLADAGFDMTSIYHYMGHGGKAANPRDYSFDLVSESSLPYWRARQQTGILPFLPNLSTGWDDRPWAGESKATVVHGRTVAKFQRICADAKTFADESGVRRRVLAPLNEWGEGSYAEPCQEFGFGMYEAVRETFCKEPAKGWPLNYAPADVGLGPYDLPNQSDGNVEAWEFAHGTEGWNAMMGLGEFKVVDGALVLTATSSDPAISTSVGSLWARRFNAVLVRAKVEPTAGKVGDLQLFWSTTAQGITEASAVSVPLVADGEFHDYLLPVAEKPRWRGRVTGFRLDPGSLSGLKMTVERVAMVPVAKP